MTLTVSLINGDLAFISGPLLVGHYVSLALTGSEAAIDRLLCGKLQRSLRARDYPEEPGTHKLFRNTRLPPDNPWAMPRPEAVVVVGLGNEGSLQAEGLKHAVANGVVAWALHAEEHRPGATSIALSATLVGSGGLNFSPGQSAQLIVQAVLEANTRLAAVDVPADSPPPPQIDQLTLVDLYLDRASDAWRALSELQQGGTADFTLCPHIARRDAALDRPLESSYRGSRYDLIVATWEETSNGDTSVRYRLDTRRARSEIHARSAQVTLLRQLLADGSDPDQLDRVLGRTLFKLLVPMELVPFMAGTNELQIEVDARSAAIPWELLDTPKDAAAPQQLPWALRTKLLRKLRTTQYRAHVAEPPDDAGVLVIGEPACPPGYARLPGARREAHTVKARFGADAGVRAMIAPEADGARGADGRTVVRTLLDRPWRVVHICGHGEAALPDNPRGVVLSDGAFLGPREVAGMQPVPELVVVNCCFAGAHGVAELAGGALAESPRFAANIADQLVAIGVRCVVATGWAVDDDAAEAFAHAFYEALLGGRRFIDAVAAARAAARECGGNTWAAYQCYGDPDWRLRQAPPDAQAPTAPLAHALSRVASVPGLLLALRTLSVRAKYHRERGEAARQALRGLQERFDPVWGGQGDVAEAFAEAWLAMGDRGAATEWLLRAVGADDGRASIGAADQLLNLRARAAAEALEAAQAGFGKPVAALSADERSRLQERARSACQDIERALEGLARLSAVVDTAERCSLRGSACKRLAMVHTAVGAHAHAAKAIEHMRTHYTRGWQLAQGRAGVDAYYPGMNVLAASVASGDAWDDALAAEVRRLVEERHRAAPDFWNATASVEIAAWEALANGCMAARLPGLVAAFTDLRDRVSDPSMWGSVRDQTRFIADARRRQAPPAEAEHAAIDALLALLEQHALDTPDQESPR